MRQDKVALIQCKDFAPRITERGPFGGASEYESFSEIVSAANQWIEQTMIQVFEWRHQVKAAGMTICKFPNRSIHRSVDKNRSHTG